MKSRVKKLLIVVLEYQNPQLTLQTLESLKQAKIPRLIKSSIVVIDNSPIPDQVLAKALKGKKNIKYLVNHKNLGFAAGNNLGIKLGLKSKTDYFLLINNDVEVDSNFLLPLIKSIKTNADIVVPKIYFAKGYEFHQARYTKKQLGHVLWYAGGYFDWDNVFGKHIGVDEVDHGQYDQEKDINFSNFCCILIKRKVFETIGLLEPKYFLYFEDADFSYRALKAGFKQLYQPQSIIYHKSSASSGSGSKLHDYYLSRNRLIFGLRYASFRTKLALIKESIKKLFTGRPGEKKGIIDYYRHKLGKADLL